MKFQNGYPCIFSHATTVTPKCQSEGDTKKGRQKSRHRVRERKGDGDAKQRRYGNAR